MLTLWIFTIYVGMSLANFADNEFDLELQSSIDEYMIENDQYIDDWNRYKRASNGQELNHEDDHIKCKQSSKKSCCGKKNLFKHFGDHNKTLGKACYEEVMQAFKAADSLPYENNSQSLFSCDKYKMMKKVQYCVFECTGRKRGLVNADGNLNIIELNAYLSNELFTEAWQRDVAEKAVKKCLKEKFAEWPVDEPGIRCNPIAVQFQHCLWKEFERNCPQSEQKDGKKCNKLREALKESSTLKKRS